MTEDERGLLWRLVERLGRLAAAEEWNGELNPAQLAALRYLDEANRFSRSPYQVAEYLSATRGTVSQTLRALARKGFVEERPSETDRRRVSYDVTPAGRRRLALRGPLTTAVERLSKAEREAAASALGLVLNRAIEAADGRSFGTCGSCRYHRAGNDGRFCSLLEVALTDREKDQICYEHVRE